MVACVARRFKQSERAKKAVRKLAAKPREEPGRETTEKLLRRSLSLSQAPPRGFAARFRGFAALSPRLKSPSDAG